MKTVSEHRQQENQSVRSIARRLFELQIDLEALNEHPHDYVLQIETVIESIDELFECLIYCE